MRRNRVMETILPPDRFLWSIIEAERSTSRRELGFLFEADLPIPIDDVWAAYTQLSDGRVLACGMKRSELQGVDPEVVSLRPSSAPPSLGEMTSDLSSLNLLSGPVHATANPPTEKSRRARRDRRRPRHVTPSFGRSRAQDYDCENRERACAGG